MKTLFVYLMLLLIPTVVVAQSETKIVTGKVIETNGDPVIGATVVIKGTTVGTVTDIDGNYRLEAPADARLVFSYIGLESKELTATQASVVKLANDNQQLEEVVVVAYGTAKKNTFTGALAVVDNNRLNTAQVTNVSNALQGAAAGVQVTSSSGQPGEAASIRVRGVGSINASSSPLYVIDGVPFDGDLASVNPADIESLVVLKDAASAALYGSRAGNGVVMITTKNGAKERAPQVNIRATAGWSKRAVKPLELMGTNDWMELRWETLRNGYMDNNYSAEEAARRASSELISDIGINPYGTQYTQPVGTDGKLLAGLNPLWDDNWDDAMIGTGHRYEVNANVSGGSKSTQYFVSAGHLEEQGITIGSGFTRTSVRTNITNQTTDWMKTFLNLSYSHSTTDFNDSQDSNVGNALSYGMNMPSFYPIYKRDPNTGAYLYDGNGNKMYDFGPYRTSSFATNNQLASIPLSKDQRKRDLVSVRGSLDFDISKMAEWLAPLDGLKFKTTYSTDISTRNNHSYSPAFAVLSTVGADGQKEVAQNLQNTSASRSTLTVKSYTFNNILTYNTEIKEDHVISLMAGQEIYGYMREYSGGSTRSFPLPGIQEPDAGSIVSSFSGYSDKFTLAGFLGRAEYNYQGIYNVSASYRRDGSSKFHPNNRWGDFWSVSLAWNMAKESFMESVEVVDLLKWRVSYGAQGNQELSEYYPYQSVYESVQVGTSPGIYINTLSNRDLTWETNLNFNLGVDFSLFSGRLRGSIEYFQRSSKDLLYGYDLSSSSGYSSILSNIGAMRNNGIEVDIKGTLFKTKNTALDMGMNLAHYKNKITSFPIKQGVQSGTKFLIEGGDIYAFKLVEWAGNTKADEPLYDRDSNGAIVEVRKAGAGEAAWYLVDENGQKYKTTQYATASVSDRQNMGSALPKIYGGINTDLKLFDFTISALLSYSIGGKLYATDFLGNYNYGTSKGRPLAQEMINRWTPENQDTDLPRLTTRTVTNSFSDQSSRHLYDGSYARLKNLAVTYNVPSKILQAVKISNASIFFQGENLFTIFGVDGIDPESGGLNGTTSYRYPAVKTYSFGINLTI
ncbi:MAG: SusC/RagA family TonB-linked outer membrane protein [Phocaeicola sp.]